MRALGVPARAGRALAAAGLLLLATGCAGADGADAAATPGATVGAPRVVATPDITGNESTSRDAFATAVRAALPPGSKVTVEVLDSYRADAPSGPEGTVAEGRYLLTVDGVRGSLDYQVTESIRPALPASAVVVRETTTDTGIRSTLVHVDGISAAAIIAHPDGRHVQTILVGDGLDEAAPLTDEQFLAVSQADVFLT